MITPFNSVEPGPRVSSLSANAATSGRAHSRIKVLAARVSKTWFALQITHFGGKYSIERMLALEEYTRDTSLLRVMLVIFGTPLPTIALVLCQESIPLQDPSEDWSTNYGFWIRMAALTTGEVCATVIQAGFLLDDISLSRMNMAFLCMCVVVGHTAIAMLVAAYWEFPVPFISFLLSMVLFAFFVGTLRIFVGDQSFRKIISQRDKLIQCSKFFSVQMLMVVIYPSYQILFDAANRTSYELPVLMLLPVLKLILKNISTFTILHKEDTIPEQVIFSVDFFDTFYLATCMQNVSSITTVLSIMCVDLVQTCVELHELHQRTNGILDRLHGAKETKRDTHGLLTEVRSLCCQTQALQTNKIKGVRVRSCIAHKLSPETMSFLENLSRHPHFVTRDYSFKFSSGILHDHKGLSSLSNQFSTWIGNIRRSVSIQPLARVGPVNAAKLHTNETSQHTSRNHSTDDSLRILHEALEVLFTNECLVLTEYMETVVPILYANYVLVMVNFPSALYHTEMQGVTTENVLGFVQNIYLYATLEFVSFVVFAVVMWRNCGMHALYQLAFVLETQATFVQPKLVLWVLTTLTYRVTHFGTLVRWFNDNCFRACRRPWLPYMLRLINRFGLCLSCRGQFFDLSLLLPSDIKCYHLIIYFLCLEMMERVNFE